MSRQAESIKRQVGAGGSQISLVIPASAKARLDKIRTSQSLTQKAAIIRLLTEGVFLKDSIRSSLEKIAERQSLTSEEVLEWLIYSERITDRANELMDGYENKSDALAEFQEELKKDYPGFDHSSKDEHPVAHKLYNQMNVALGWEEMRRRTENGVGNIETTGGSPSSMGLLRSIFRDIRTKTGR